MAEPMKEPSREEVLEMMLSKIGKWYTDHSDYLYTLAHLDDDQEVTVQVGDQPEITLNEDERAGYELGLNVALHILAAFPYRMHNINQPHAGAPSRRLQ